VVFVPGLSDPITAISSQKPTTPPTTRPTTTNSNPQYTKERRLTPNSRNIHQNWMSLSPGLGFAGLLYLDWQRLQQQNPPPLEDGDEEEDEDDEEDDHGGSDDDDDDDDEDYSNEETNTSSTCSLY
jgi:hypothetical protein